MTSDGACTGAKGAMAGGCCSGKKMKTMASVLPRGTQMKKVDVAGGIDLVFWGKNLGAIQTALTNHISQCSGRSATGTCLGQTCTMTVADNSVVLSIRGDNPQACCAGLFTSDRTSVKRISTKVKASEAQKTAVKTS